MARSAVLRYGSSIVTVLVALLLSIYIPPLQDRDLLMFMLIAVISSTWYGGLGPGLAATFLGAVSTTYLFLPPIRSFSVAAQEDLLQVGAFVGVAIVISWFVASRKQSVAALQTSEARVRQLNEALEQRVLERTTELEAANRALKLQTALLSRINAELERFVYASSHDLQEPLRTITSFLELLSDRYRGKLDAEADEFIDYAVDGALRMKRLIHDVLAYSRVSPPKPRVQEVDCEAVWNQVVTHLKTAIEQSQAIVTHDPLPTISGDATQFVQLFQNLVDNALKFRLKTPLTVHMSVERIGPEWVFSLHDNGIGIEPQYAERIFEVFQRLCTRAEYPGTGVGLAICKKIVESHGGRIWVSSQLGEGATFYFTVAVSPVEGTVPPRSPETGSRKLILFRQPSG